MIRATGHRTLPRTRPRPSSCLRLGAVAAAALVLAAGCGGSGNGNPSAPALQRVAAASLRPGSHALSRPLPPDWSIALRAWFDSPRSALRISLGSNDVTVFDGSHIWHVVQLTREGLVIDGHRAGSSSLEASGVTLRALHGGIEIRGLVIRRLAHPPSG